MRDDMAATLAVMTEAIRGAPLAIPLAEEPAACSSLKRADPEARGSGLRDATNLHRPAGESASPGDAAPGGGYQFFFSHEAGGAEQSKQPRSGGEGPAGGVSYQFFYEH